MCRSKLRLPVPDTEHAPEKSLARRGGVSRGWVSALALAAGVLAFSLGQRLEAGPISTPGLWAWGAFGAGQQALIPQLYGNVPIREISALRYDWVALFENGEVWETRWTEPPLTQNRRVLTGAEAVAAGGDGSYPNSTHSLAVLSDGTVWVWGRNDFGQWGLGALAVP